jgi:hypothetical protein
MHTTGDDDAVRCCQDGLEVQQSLPKDRKARGQRQLNHRSSKKSAAH